MPPKPARKAEARPQSRRTAAQAASITLNEIINKLNHIKQNNTRINIPKSE